MKKLYKFRHLIGVVLTFAVSVMLLVSSFPASAQSLKPNYYSYYENANITDFGSIGNIMRLNSSYCYVDKQGAFICHTSTFSSLGLAYNDSKLNGTFSFIIEAPAIWSVGFNGNQLSAAFIYRGLSGAIAAFQSSASNYEYNVIGNGMARFVFTVPASAIAAHMNYKGWYSADIIGVGVRSDGNYTGNFKLVTAAYISKNEVYGFDGGELKWYSPLTRVIGEIFDASTSVLTKAIDLIGVAINGIWNYAKPVLKPLLEEVLLPTLNGILNTVGSLATKIVEVLSPVLADMINFFSPYFNRISDIITNNFLNLVENLTPLVNKFVTAISPSLDSIVTNISSNISKIIKECFVPDDTSAEYQEFVGMKDEITNKFPIFNQLHGFVSALFNPQNYQVSYNDDIYTMIKNFGSFGNNEHNVLKPFPIYFLFDVNRYYLLTFTSVTTSVNKSYITFYDTDGNIILRSYAKDGLNEISFCLTKNCGVFYVSGYDSFTVSDVRLYTLKNDKAVSSDFIVNVYGTEVSVLDFNWYMPYKKYGDILVISFCYLAFVWRTFKRLPNII